MTGLPFHNIIDELDCAPPTKGLQTRFQNGWYALASMAERTSKLPSLDLLKGFEAAARHLNFTKAADELFVTQSAVSRQVQALEERLGVRLFVRQRRGLLLTYEGERLFRSVQGALRQVQEVIDSLSQRPAGNRVTLTSTMAFCALWLIPRLGEFNRLFPEVGVRIAANDQVLNLERERIDVSVRYCTRQGGAARIGLAVRRRARAGVLSRAAGAHRQAVAASA